MTTEQAADLLAHSQYYTDSLPQFLELGQSCLELGGSVLGVLTALIVAIIWRW